MKTIQLKIDGISCASCVNNIESTLIKNKAIETITVNIMNDTGTVMYDPSVLDETQIIQMIQQTGYDAVVIDQHQTLQFQVEGMTCSSCALAVSSAIEGLSGLSEHHVNVATDSLSVTIDPSLLRISQIKDAVSKAGYTLMLKEDLDETVDYDQLKMEKAKKKMLIAGSITTVMMTMMVIHMFVVMIPFYTPIVAVMAIPIIFILGLHVHQAAYKSLRNKKPNMDVLVSMGSLPPYLIGLMGLFFPITTFIEMAATIMTFHLVGKYLETRAKGKASQAIKKLIELGAKTARVLVDGEEIEISVKELSPGDIMVIRPGEKIPTDGIVFEGESLIDESIATGESMPVKRIIGDPVIGATLNKQGLLKVKVTKTGDQTFLSQVIKLVEAAQGTKVPIQEFADKITGYFVPAVMGLTLLTFTSFMIFNNFHASILTRMSVFLPWINPDQTPLTLAFITATAVLVIACPCALGLGTPTALMVGSGIGADNGILIRNGEAVQTLKDIKAIAFDKTGTLTYGKPVVTDVYVVHGSEEDLIKVAASLEKGSEHPLASAMIHHAEEQQIPLYDLTGFEAVTGKGIKALLNGVPAAIGNLKLFEEDPLEEKLIKEMNRLEEEAKTVMVVKYQDQILGLIAVADQIKENAPAVISAIENLGIKTVMITGDNERTAQAIAAKAGISVVVASVLPDGKVDQIKTLQETYGKVAMVGDGINDAPALKQANVGMALGTGTDIAIEAADVTLVRGDLETILSAIILSQGIFRKIKENYFWAWFYNAIAIPFAMLGLLHPMIGAAAMSVSSLNVIYNSLRLKKINVKKPLEARYVKG